MGLNANTYYAGMCRSGNRTEIVPMVERPSSNGKVSASIPDSVTFLHCWFKKLFSLYCSLSVKNYC